MWLETFRVRKIDVWVVEVYVQVTRSGISSAFRENKEA
jgi:hypothetical protein